MNVDCRRVASRPRAHPSTPTVPDLLPTPSTVPLTAKVAYANLPRLARRSREPAFPTPGATFCACSSMLSMRGSLAGRRAQTQAPRRSRLGREVSAAAEVKDPGV